jgi:hypothetical protein
MPRYFFHSERRGQVVADLEGTELADLDEARHEAFLNARDLLILILKTAQPVPLDDRVHVVDEQGAVLYTVTLREALRSAHELKLLSPSKMSL